MINIKSPGPYTGAGLLSAFAASLCCITPVIALLAGSSSIASNFSWIDPARPYLIGLTIVVLAFAWYGKLKPAKTNDMDCNCQTTPTTSFLQSKSFLGIVTVFAMLMLTFPLYAKIFYPKPKVEVAKTSVDNTNQKAIFIIQGMTCEGCEAHVNNELSKVAGVLTYKTSYNNGNSLVTFNSSKVHLETVEAAINKTGYKVTKYNVVNSSNTAITSKEVKLR
jgi:mercuric ion transport protein